MTRASDVSDSTAGPRLGRRRFLALPAALALAAAVEACGGGGGGGDSDSSSEGTPLPSAPPAVAAGGHGLLLPRDQRLLLRDMTDGKEYVLKRSPADVFYTYPRWSPDGARIAYALDIPFTGQPNQQWGSDIAISPTDGSTEQIVVKRPAAGFQVQGLAWSPDGSAVYAGILETTIKDGRFLGQTLRLERIDIATGAREPLIEDATNPTVARDGSHIAYTTYGSATEPGGLWTARLDGTDRRLILPMTGRFAVILYPRFSPDSSTIAFSAATLQSGAEPSPAPRSNSGSAWRWPWQPRTAVAHGLPMDIWLIPAAGGDPTRLTNMLEDEPSPAWSPDGTQIAIVATGGLYLVSASGGEPQRIGIGGTLLQIDWR